MRTLDVAFSANKAYSVQLSVALTSLRHNLQPRFALCITILSIDMTPDEIRWPNRGPNDVVKIFQPDIAESLLPVGAGDHVTVETYFRIFIDTAFDETIAKVLYLDSDLVVLGDISPLFDINLESHSCAAVRDASISCWSGSSGIPTAGTDSGKLPYFNAGVLLIHLNNWRRQRVRTAALDFLAANFDTVLFWDQDALNYAVGANWLELPGHWNRQSCGRTLTPFCGWCLPLSARSLKQPSVAHFAGRSKPWTQYLHPDRRVYDLYLAKSGQSHLRLRLADGLKRRARAWLRQAKNVITRSMV